MYSQVFALESKEVVLVIETDMEIIIFPLNALNGIQ
jgi:hypothetical protein